MYIFTTFTTSREIAIPKKHSQLLQNHGHQKPIQSSMIYIVSPKQPIFNVGTCSLQAWLSHYIFENFEKAKDDRW